MRSVDGLSPYARQDTAMGITMPKLANMTVVETLPRESAQVYAIWNTTLQRA